MTDRDRSLTWTRTRTLGRDELRVFRVARHLARHPVLDHEREFVVLEGLDWVNVIALTPSDEVVLVRQYRHGIERITHEIPGGVVEAGEEPLVAAQRELREETGYAAARWMELGWVHPNPAIQTNTCYTFLALDAERVGEQHLDAGEAIEVELAPLSEMPAWMRDARITHSLVVVAFAQLVWRAGGLVRPA